MTRFAIVADDLSSATDCGAQVVRSGLSVLVPLGGGIFGAQDGNADVISIDTDSRNLPADRAYENVKSAMQQLVEQGWTNFYKSVDSTLRGNLEAEIEAMLDVVQPDFAIVAPAFPKYGRTTVDGVQYLHGRPLHETEFGTDPTAPVRDADLAKRLSEGSNRKVGRLSLEDVRAGAEQTQSAVQKLVDEGVELVIVDIAEPDDLQQLCLGLSQSKLRILWVGSTGLAEFVPLAFGAPLTTVQSRQMQQTDARPALALIGSASETTREQLRFAQAQHGLTIVPLDALRLLQDQASELDAASSALRVALEHGNDVALVVRASREEVAATQQLGTALDLSPTQVAQRIVDALAQVSCHLVGENQLSGIVATGGDTANALCNALGAQALEILGEVEAGIPILRVVGKQPLPLVTKAGGFGSDAAIADALAKVKHYA